MSPDGPKVRDFTAPDSQLRVTVETSSVYELLLGLFVWGNQDDAGEYECGSTFFERLKNDPPPEVAAELALVSDSGNMWLSLIGLAQAVPGVRSVVDLVSLIKDMDPIELRRTLIHQACLHTDLKDDTSTIDAAATGDMDAIATLLAADDHCNGGFRNLMESAPEVTVERITTILTGANAVLEPSISDALPALRRDADEKRSLASSMDAPRLVETATNGVTFTMQPHISEVLLIPSKIIRPWTVIIDHEGTQIFGYSVSDEHLNADPDAPPAYLVELYKALGDERRLRMLAMLAEGELSLMEIAERVDLAKSTAHHHLRILRTAGLVRVTIGDSKAYSLRRDRVPEASRLLDAFLTTSPAEAISESTTDTPRS